MVRVLFAFSLLIELTLSVQSRDNNPWNAFYDATMGDKWDGVCCSGIAKEDPCLCTDHISCDSLGGVEEIELSNCTVGGILPQSLCDLPLTKLDLSSNGIRGPLPDLSQCTLLEALNLDSNWFEGYLPALSHSTHLRVLELGNNLFVGTIPDISALTQLTSIQLVANNLVGPLPQLATLTSLERLDMSKNSLSGTIPDLTGLTELKLLFLAENALTGTLPSMLDLGNLEIVVLHRNQLEGWIPPLSGMTSLNGLSLYDNRLTGTLPVLPPTLLAKADDRHSFVILHRNFLSCGLPAEGGMNSYDSEANSVLVAPGNAFASYPKIPRWVSPQEQKASMLFVHHPLYQWLPLIAIASTGVVVLAISFTFSAGGLRTALSLVSEVVATRTQCHEDASLAFLALCLRGILPLAVLSLVGMLPVLITNGSLYECGRSFSRTTIAYLAESGALLHSILHIIYTIVACVMLVWIRTAGRTQYRVRGIRHERLPNHEFGFTSGRDWVGVLQWIVLIVMWFGSVLVLSIPTLIFELIRSLPEENYLDISTSSAYVVEYLTAPLLLAISLVVVPSLSRTVARLGMPHKSEEERNRVVMRFILVSRLLLLIVIPIAGVIVMNEGCFQHWKTVWTPCSERENSFDVVFDGKIQVLSGRDLCTPRYRADGRCPRAVAELASTLILRKVGIQAFLTPLMLLLRRRSLMFLGRWRLNRVLQRLHGSVQNLRMDQIGVVALSWVELAIVYGWMCPLIFISIIATLLTHLLTYRLICATHEANVESGTLNEASLLRIQRSITRPPLAWVLIAVVIQTAMGAWWYHETQYTCSFAAFVITVSTTGLLCVHILWRPILRRLVRCWAKCHKESRENGEVIQSHAWYDRSDSSDVEDTKQGMLNSSLLESNLSSEHRVE